MTHTRRAEVVPLYHVPRSQVWEGSRGRQSGRVHLHVNGRALCGVRSPWYPRDPLISDQRCSRCEARAERNGIAWPLTAGDQGERPDGTGRVAPADGCAERQSTADPSPAASAGPDTPAAHSFERKLMGYVGGDDDTSEWYGTCSCGWRGPLREDVDAPREDWVRARADLTDGVECDACGSPATRYDLDGQWCDVHDRTSACMDCGELDCPGPRLPANGPDTPADSQEDKT